MNNINYQLTHERDTLIFTTSSFKAEKTSVLHSGVYTKEFASMLFASAMGIAVYMAFDLLTMESKIMRSILLVIIFTVSFLFARKFIFKEKYLEVRFDKPARTVSIIKRGIVARHTEKIPFDRIKSIDPGHRKFEPENLDGIDFVQKISAQHGSAVPGLSEAEEFITLSLCLTDGTERMIFAVKIESGKVDGEPEIPLREIKEFLL